jgi:hypothetical protein
LFRFVSRPADGSECVRVGSAVFEIIKKEVVLADRIMVTASGGRGHMASRRSIS